MTLALINLCKCPCDIKRDFLKYSNDFFVVFADWPGNTV